MLQNLRLIELGIGAHTLHVSLVPGLQQWLFKCFAERGDILVGKGDVEFNHVEMESGHDFKVVDERKES